MNPSGRHVSTESLVDFVEGHLPSQERPSIESHVASCARCSSQAAAFGHVITTMRADDTEDTPEHVVNRAVRLFRVHRLGVDERTPRRRVLGVLRLDSAQRPFAFGMRAASSAARELLFNIDDESELEVRIERSDEGWRVAGQILGACSGGEVVLEGSGGVATTELNELCEFSLPPQQGAIYKLLLQLKDVDVEVPILELRG